MNYARINKSGKVVHATDATRGPNFTCPTCGLPVELRRGDSLEYFAHQRGLEGARECELFVPGRGADAADGAGSRVPGAQVEDDPAELGLIIDQLDGEWGVGLRLPEIPREELGDVSLNELRPASVEVSVGGTVVSRVSALDIRPGVGTARVAVHPTVQEYRARAAGSWPLAINAQRWQLQARGIDARGTLFRLRGGEWTRLLSESGVHHDECLLVLADERSSPPPSIVTETHARISGANGWRCTLWEVQIPDEPTASVVAWIQRLEHVLVPRPWSIDLATPPRACDERGKPIFWVGDAPVLALQAPQAGAEARVWFSVGTESINASVKTAKSRDAHVAIKSQDVGPARLTAIAERSVNIDVAFAHRPSLAAILQLLTRTPRVRAWIGDLAIEAWHGPTSIVPVTRVLPEVRVDLGSEDARARVTVWERGKQRSSRGLDARNAARAIEVALPTASRIELDADNLGRLDIVPAHEAAATRHRSSVMDRLAWHDHVVSLCNPPEGQSTPTIIEQPRSPMSLALKRVGAPSLARSRQALRRRHEAGGTRR